MLIKTADDKRKRLQLLTELQQSPQLDWQQKQWLRKELERTRTGMEGERDAAHYIDSWKKDSDNHAILHDLRLRVEGEVAQIDHLVITRGLHVYLFETKCFNGHLHINAHGEFTVRYGDGQAYGIPSPLEQSRRHERILAKLMERLEITGRVGLKPSFHHVVLLHPKAIIERPDPKAFDTQDIIKADQIASWHNRYIAERVGLSGVLGSLANFHSIDTLRGWAEKLARQHRPADALALPEFMAPRAPAAGPAAAIPRQDAERAKAPEPDSSAAQPAASAAVESHPLYRKLICAQCQQKISYPEGKFCWNNSRRFGGLQYCRTHQADRP